MKNLLLLLLLHEMEPNKRIRNIIPTYKKAHYWLYIGVYVCTHKFLQIQYATHMPH